MAVCVATAGGGGRKHEAGRGQGGSQGKGAGAEVAAGAAEAATDRTLTGRTLGTSSGFCKDDPESRVQGNVIGAWTRV
jgi:hypothetical protein